jgi:hypothetical protein
MAEQRKGMRAWTVILSVLVMAGLVNAASIAGGKSVYLVESKHTPEQCLAALDAMSASAPKMLSTINWGCMSGDHTGYAFVNAPSESAVREMLPESLRASAHIVKVDKFTVAQIKSFHQK